LLTSVTTTSSLMLQHCADDVAVTCM
jgi:hypothetical protein